MAQFFPILSSFVLSCVFGSPPWDDATISNGCFMWGWEDPSANVELTGDVGDVPKCHKACLDRQDCTTFSLIQGKCFVGSTGRFGDDLVRSEASTLSGPRVCLTPASSCARTNIPDSAFPGETEEAAMQAWPTGFQPQEMMCWQKDESQNYLACPEMTTLETITEVGECMNFRRRVLSAGECEALCMREMSCAMWVTSTDHCYTSSGEDCDNEQMPVSVVSGKRILRGSTRTLRSWSHERVKNLKKAFSVDHVNKLIGEGKDATSACRIVCLSILDCQYWQLYDGEGCFVEKTSGFGQTVQYPLTKDGVVSDMTQVAGEYIQRYCPSQIGEETTTTTTTTTMTTATTTTTTTSNPLILQNRANRGGGESGSGESSGGSGGDGSFAASSGSGSLASSGSSDSSSSGSAGSGSGSGASGYSRGSDVSGSGGSGSDGSDSSDSWPWWSWGLCFFLILCCLVGIIGLAYGLLHGFDKKAPKKRRRRRDENQFDNSQPLQVSSVQERVYEAPRSAPQYVVHDPVPTSMTQMPMYQRVEYVPVSQAQQQFVSAQPLLPTAQQQLPVQRQYFVQQVSASPTQPQVNMNQQLSY